MNAIEAHRISKSFGEHKAVDRADLAIPTACIYGILGPNGAGKTTTLRMINHIMHPDTGTIHVMGQPVSGVTQELIGYMPEERGLYKKMKVLEQLLYIVQLKGLSKTRARRSIDYWLERFGAEDWINMELGELSKGMQQKIQFIVTIAHDPQICIFDEPFSGLDPINSELLKRVIIELSQQGKTIIFATHRMEQVEQMCDHICLFNQGRVILDGNLADIKSSFGQNTVELTFTGDSSFLDRLDNVRINDHSANFAEIRLLEGTDEQQILKTAMQYARIHKFERVEPSLTEIFISSVGGKKEALEAELGS